MKGNPSNKQPPTNIRQKTNIQSALFLPKKATNEYSADTSQVNQSGIQLLNQQSSSALSAISINPTKEEPILPPPE